MSKEILLFCLLPVILKVGISKYLITPSLGVFWLNGTNNVLETKCGQLKLIYWRASAEVASDDMKGGNFLITFWLQLFQGDLNFGTFYYIIDNFSCCLKFKCWRETISPLHFDPQER